ncbi:hypothetical protein AB4Y30_01575 [Ornithinibacillus sp. 4-3]|uniref:Trimeric autotransporter adhesin YadA-like head domain-containing protein n=1 Tax=Ornithinibacillus sp. 4-3 TaxID=3231488 RepID=A0AB39HRB7_9BACI
MSFEKKEWSFDDTPTEEDANRWEKGIDDAHQLVEEHKEDKDNPHGVTSEQVNLLKNLPEEDIPLSGYPLGLSTFERSQTISGVAYTYTFNVTKTSDTNGLMEIFTLDSEGGKRRVLYRWDNDNHSWDLGTMVYDQKNKPSKSDVGLGNVQNYSIASQAQAEAGTSSTVYMSPLRTKQAIEALATSSLITYINTIPFDAPGDEYSQGITCMYAGNGWSTALYNAVGAGNVINIATNNQYITQIYLPKSINSYSDAHVRYFASSQEGTWTEFEPINKVKSVNGKTGNVTINKQDVGLEGEGAKNVVLGENAVSSAQDTGVVIGTDASTNKRRSIAIGFRAQSLSVNGVAIGTDSAVGDSSVSNRGSVAIGYKATSDGAGVSLGTNAFSQMNDSLALGTDARAEGVGSVAIGRLSSTLNNAEGVLGTATTPGVNNWIVRGNLNVNGTKNFEMPHPKPSKRDTHVIRHSAVESPTAGDNLYRYKVTASTDNDIQYIDLPDYFVHLNKDVQIFVTGQGHFGNGYGLLNRETEQLEIHCQLPGAYNVLAIGTRNDDHQSVQDWDIKGLEREIGESWTGETYVFEDNEIISDEEIVGGY